MTPEGRLIAHINVAHALCHYCLLILPTTVLAMVGSGGFGTDYGPILALATGMFVLYGVLSLPQSWLAARIGRRRLIAVYFFGTGAALLACGVAPSPLMLGAGLAAVGAFASIYHPIGTAMLVDAAGDAPGRAIGLNGVCGNAGVAVAPVLTALIVVQFGWPAAFILPGLVFAAMGVAWLRLPAVHMTRPRSTRPFPVIPRAVVRQAMVVLLLIAVVSGLVFNAFTLLIPKLMQERLDGQALPLLGAAAFVATMFGAASQFTVGRLIDRMTLRRIFLPLAMIAIPALVALAFVGGWWVVPVAGLVSVALFGQLTVNETMTARYFTPALRARMYSWRFFVGFIGSAGAAPLVGFLHESTGSLAAPALVLAGVAAVTLVCALWFPDRPEELQPELWLQRQAAE